MRQQTSITVLVADATKIGGERGVRFTTLECLPKLGPNRIIVVTNRPKGKPSSEYSAAKTALVEVLGNENFVELR